VTTGGQIGFVREPFPGNIIPASRLDPNAIKLLDLYPLPTNSGLFNNYATNPVARSCNTLPRGASYGNLKAVVRKTTLVHAQEDR
jgi:hypothetical protein